MDLPAQLKESLAESDYTAVLEWWASLSPEQQREVSDISEMTPEDFRSLNDLDEMDPDPETQPYYDYLVNHELRMVPYLDDVSAKSTYKIVSTYIATLGSDYHHGESGTVG